MCENNETWDVVLYYVRKVIYLPDEPNFEDIKNSNPNLNMDELLDAYSDAKIKYKEEFKNNTNFTENSKDVISSFVFFTQDETFEENVRNFEKHNFFVEWNKDSKKLIYNTINKLYKV